MKSILCALASRFFLALPLALPATPAAAQAIPAPFTTSVLRIDQMSTPSCPALVKAAVRKLDGIAKVEVSLEHKTATVEYDASKTHVAEIQRAIKQKVGFDSKLTPGH
jgi:periplasmic mercuric ion binding protein